MNSSFSSVSKMFLSMKSSIREEIGASVVRESSLTDTIFQLGSTFLRARMVDIDSTRSIQFLMGDDEERIGLDETDPRFCLPFEIDPSAPNVVASTWWSPPSSVWSLTVSSDDMRRYRVDCSFEFGKISVFHQYHIDPSKQGNFHQTGFDFMRCGA